MSTPTGPSPRQYTLLAELVAAGATPTIGRRRDQLNSRFLVSTWVAVVEYGWVTVDRGTPDNKGGDPTKYRYYPADNIHEILAAGPQKSNAHATEARLRIGDEKAAQRLRKHGWIIFSPATKSAVAEALHVDLESLAQLAQLADPDSGVKP